MHDHILSELRKLEEEKQIKILYAVESGSRAWGFASKNSDWDVRFIYVHHPDWYMAIDELKDSMEIMRPNDLDLSGWELKKALRLFRKSNPPLLEWLHSPLIYMTNGNLAERMRGLMDEYFSPRSCMHHYLHMAEGNERSYLQSEVVRVKKYFYVLRPILACMWIEKHNSMPPVEFERLLKEFMTQGELREAIDALTERKMAGEELDKEPQIPILQEFIKTKLHYFKEEVMKFYKPYMPDTNKLNDLFKAILIEYRE